MLQLRRARLTPRMALVTIELTRIRRKEIKMLPIVLMLSASKTSCFFSNLLMS